MAYKICVLGTHGAGKSTLVFKLAAHFKQIGKNIKIVQEVARSCPFPINENMTENSYLWIYHEHNKKELEAQKNSDIVISDRSALDSFLYAQHFKIRTNDYLERAALINLRRGYDKIFFVRPNVPISADSVRPGNEEFQLEMDKKFSITIENFSLEVLEITTSQIFEDKWKSYTGSFHV